MSEIVQPQTLDELMTVVDAADSVLPVGRRTKIALSSNSGATLVSLAKLSGILQYEPSEFTFTALAGTPLSEVVGALAERNQYLPFDPPLVDAGATLGGTVAAGLSGPGRVRFGGLRDFLLGVRFLSGDSHVINSGGKVVKNAAGFDIPKLLVGSLGRLGVMTELTFKVFPKAVTFQTYRIACESDTSAITRIVMAATSRWELDAIDYRPDDGDLYFRIGGPESANNAIASEIARRCGGELQLLDPDQAMNFWTAIRELNWTGQADCAVVVKVPITPQQFLSLMVTIRQLEGLNAHLSAAGAVLWVAADSAESLTELSGMLRQSNLSGLVVRGACDRMWLGCRDESQMAAAVKAAMDPAGKFPHFAAPESVR